MEEKIAIIGIFITDHDSVESVNNLLHKYASKIEGRMGLPHRESGTSIISVILRATSDEISTLAGNLGRLPGVNAKSMQTSIN